VGQQGESQAGKLRAILARNTPAQASVVDQLDIDENWKYNIHAAELEVDTQSAPLLESSPLLNLSVASS